MYNVFDPMPLQYCKTRAVRERFRIRSLHRMQLAACTMMDNNVIWNVRCTNLSVPFVRPISELRDTPSLQTPVQLYMSKHDGSLLFYVMHDSFKCVVNVSFHSL